MPDENIWNNILRSVGIKKLGLIVIIFFCSTETEFCEDTETAVVKMVPKMRNCRLRGSCFLSMVRFVYGRM